MKKIARPVIIAGNWKMNKLRDEAKQLAVAVVNGVKGLEEAPEVVLCPPFTSLSEVAGAAAGSRVGVGAQNMEYRESGAYTGEVSGPMILDAGASWVIIGHSERRQYYGETNQTVNLKLKAAISHKLLPIVCVGETEDERESNLTDSVVKRQVAAALEEVSAEDLSSVVFAYEPVWAIGTGKTCESAEANRVCQLIRATISGLYNSKSLAELTPVLYGGSVKPANIEEILAQSDIDGALVGGASLKKEDFLSLIKAGQARQAVSAG